jgi:hypothetical protein
MKRMAVAVLVALLLGMSASPSFAGWHHRRVVRERVVVVRHLLVGPRVVVHRVHRRLVRVPRRAAHHLHARFIPLPVPRGVPVPPPFSPRHPF